MIGSVPASIMRWIGGGIDPFQDNSTNEGKGFAQHVVGRGESALQAGMGAAKNNRDNKRADDKHSDTMKGQAAHTKAVNENTAKMGELMGKPSNGGGDGGGPGGGGETAPASPKKGK